MSVPPDAGRGRSRNPGGVREAAERLRRRPPLAWGSGRAGPQAPGLGGDPARSALDDRQYVPCGQDQVLLAGVLHLGAAVLRVEDGLADLHVERDPLGAVLVPAAGAHGDDRALLGLLFRGVRNHDAGSRRRLGLVGLDHDPVLQRLDGDLGCGGHDLSPPPDGVMDQGCVGVRARAGLPSRCQPESRLVIGTLLMRVPTTQPGYRWAPAPAESSVAAGAGGCTARAGGGGSAVSGTVEAMDVASFRLLRTPEG